MHNDIEKILIDEDVIQKRLDVLAEKVREEFEGQSIVVVALLKERSCSWRIYCAAFH